MLKRKIFVSCLAVLISISTFSVPTTVFAIDNDFLKYDSKAMKAYNELYKQDQAAINEIYQNLPSMLEEGNKLAKSDAKSSEIQMRSGSSLGTYGDILVSLIINSGSVGFAGHADIVSSNSLKTIESYAKSWSTINKDGVQYYDNAWNNESGALLVRPIGATILQYNSAASYAANQVGKAYNWIFTDKYTTDKFYCSQLVWRAWLNQGINCETGSIPNAIIAPADLVNSSNTYIVKQVQ
jgi:uncharacterized protein YycO